MTLDKITAAPERHRVIHYGSDGNKVVRHWFDVRQVSGSIYMGNEREDEYHNPLFDLFVIFPEGTDGMFWACMGHAERYTVEQVVEAAKREHVDSAASFMADLNDRMERDIHIGNAMIEFVRQWDAPMADRCAAYRADRYARIEERERQRRAEEEAEEAARKAEEEARKDAEDKAERAKYLGWADKMTALRFGKVHTHMDSVIRSDGKYMTRRDFVIARVREGWMPEKEEDVTHWYGRGWSVKESKPRTEYRLRRENEHYTVSKTEFDFAQYCVKHGKEAQ